MYTYTYHPDVHYPYICTDVPTEESSDSHSSLPPETPAGQYYVTATTTSPTHLWAQPSEWSSWETAFNYHQQVETHSSQSYPYHHHDVRNGGLSLHTQATGYTALAPPAYSEATVSGGASMAYSHEEAEAEECHPRCDVFDEPLRREDYMEMERIRHGGKTMDRANGSVGEGRVSFHERQQQVYAAQQLVYAAEAPYSNQHVYGDAYGQSIYQEQHHQPPSQPPRKAYPVHPQVCYEQEWAVAQASSSIQQRGLPMEILRAEHGFGQRQEERPTHSYPQTVMVPTLMNPYPQIPRQMWPQGLPRHPSPAPAAIPISSSSSLANAITPPVPMVKKTSGPRPESTTTSVPATRRSPSQPVPPKPPTPVPIVPSQSHLAPPPVPFSAGAGSSSKAPQSPSIPPPRLPRNPRREQSSFRPFHPYPAHRRPSATSVAASSSNPAASNTGDDCSAAFTSPIPVFGLFGSYPLPDGSDTPLPGPTCTPETSSSVMRLVLTSALKKHHHQDGVLGIVGVGEAGGLGSLAGLASDGRVVAPPVVRRPRLACFFCRKRKIACGLRPGAGDEGTGSSLKDGSVPSPEGSSSLVIEGGTGASASASASTSTTAGGDVHPQNQEDDGSCNQCARRGLRCERPTESRRGVRKGKKRASEDDGFTVPRKKNVKKDADKATVGSSEEGGGDGAGGYDEDPPMEERVRRR